MNYNVKMIQYMDSLQLRIYHKPITVSKKIPCTGIPLKSNQNISCTPSERTQEQIQHSIDSSVNRTVNQIYSIARSNKWEYFITLTIDPQKLDNTDFALLLLKLSTWTNNLRKRYAPDLKYLIVPELHKDKIKWHFHGLISNVGSIPFVFSGKTCVGKYVYDYVKKPYATKIYNLPLWKYGFSTATKIRDSSKASSYITKYITKDLSRILQGQHRYVASQNVDTPIEKVFNLEYAALQDILKKHMEHVDYISNVSVQDAGQLISYMEFNK